MANILIHVHVHILDLFSFNSSMLEEAKSNLTLLVKYFKYIIIYEMMEIQSI